MAPAYFEKGPNLPICLHFNQLEINFFRAISVGMPLKKDKKNPINPFSV